MIRNSKAANTRTARFGRRTAVVLGATAASAALVLSSGSVASAAPQAITAAAQCPAGEIKKIWYGGTSTVKACEYIADRLDHLFYPGHMFTTAMAGTYSESVVFIQLRLRDLNYSPLAIDGYYGNQTAGAVTRYQRNHGLVVDGKVGAQTWEELFGLGPA